MKTSRKTSYWLYCRRKSSSYELKFYQLGAGLSCRNGRYLGSRRILYCRLALCDSQWEHSQRRERKHTNRPRPSRELQPYASPYLRKFWAERWCCSRQVHLEPNFFRRDSVLPAAAALGPRSTQGCLMTRSPLLRNSSSKLARPFAPSPL